MPSEEEEIIIRNGELKKWWNAWIKNYRVILLGTEAKPALKVHAWEIFAWPAALLVVLAFALGVWIG